MTERLRGKTALVTGAAGGMGREHALRLAREGADLILLDLAEGRDDVALGYELSGGGELDAVRAEVEALGRRCVAPAADVSDHGSLADAAELTAAEFPTLDVIVANAGIGAYAGLLADDPGPWQAVIDVNLTGVFNTAHVFVPRMIAGGRGGSIVIIGSTAGVKGLPFCSAYAASKHGLHGLRKVWAQELAAHGIRVNTVDPGAIDTKLAHDVAGPLAGSASDSPEARLFLGSFNPLLEAPGGLIPPTAISDAVAWLASDEARYVTGISLPVDAGTTVR